MGLKRQKARRDKNKAQVCNFIKMDNRLKRVQAMPVEAVPLQVKIAQFFSSQEELDKNVLKKPMNP